MSIVKQRKEIIALLRKVKDKEFLDEIEDLLRNGKKWTEEEKLDRNFGVQKKVVYENHEMTRAEGMNAFIDDIWP
mgnify:CR=1 FL=1